MGRITGLGSDPQLLRSITVSANGQVLPNATVLPVGLPFTALMEQILESGAAPTFGLTSDQEAGIVGAKTPLSATNAVATAADLAKSADTYAALPYAAGISLDFSTANVQSLALTAGTTFTTSANVAVLKTKEVYLTNPGTSAAPLGFPSGWSFFPGPAPTSLAAGKQAVLTLRCLGADDSTIKAAYVAQA